MSWLEPIGARVTPANFGPLRGFNAHARIEGSCGDTMEFWLRLDGVKVVQATFTTDGCETSVACGSMAAHLCLGRSLGELRGLRPIDVLEALGLGEAEGAEEAHHCADLALSTLSRALGDYERTLRAEAEGGAGADGCDGGCGGGCCEACEEDCAGRDPGDAGAPARPDRRHILVMSGKGGVGKSTVAVNLALGLAERGLEVGLLDVDVHGPSVPKLLGLEAESIHAHGNELLPVEVGNLKVMSMGFALGADEAAIWRGPMKAGVVDQFVKQVAWGPLDVMVVDCPPGTGDEHLSVHQALGSVEGAVIVTTPQEVATLDARKAITFCRSTGIPVLGIIENMSGFSCPACGSVTPVFQSGGGERLAKEAGLPFLGSLPLDPSVGLGGDAGKPRLFTGKDGAAAQAFLGILRALAPAPAGFP